MLKGIFFVKFNMYGTIKKGGNRIGFLPSCIIVG